MAKKKTDRVGTGGGDALTHSPFAALLGGADPTAEADDAASGDAPRGDAPSGAAPSDDPRATDPRTSDPRATDTTPFEAKLVVRTEKKGRGGKTVTRVSGVRPGSREAIATRLKKALGCGATVEDDDVVLLGDVEDRAAAWLEENGARRIARGR